MSKNLILSTSYKNPLLPGNSGRLFGLHHFAHLRAVAQGISVEESAWRYLGIEHGNEARAAHQQTVDAIRSVARRKGDSAWRLVGVNIGDSATHEQPSIAEFMADRCLDDWSHSEVLEFYRDAYPVDRKASRSVRLRKRTIDLLRILEDLCVRQPEQNDLVSGWFDESIALKLTRSGIETLGQLASTVAQGGDWYSVLPQVGPAKANRIASHLQMLIGAGQRMQAVHFSHSSSLAALPSPDAATKTDPIVFSRDVIERLTPITFNEHPKQDCSDRQAIHAWITRTAGSLATSKSYLREARRLQLWLHFESGGKTLADMTPLDCERYVLFLTNVPDRWISTCRAAPGDPGWAPFRGKLGNSSLIQAVRVVGALFNWLHTSCHLSSNVWIQTIKSADLVSPVDPTISGGSVFHPSVNLLRFLDRQAPSLSRSRMRLICILSMNDGIRPTELLNARIGDLVCQRRKWRLPVTSGSKSRVVKLSKQAMQSIVEYSIYCGYKSLDQAPANLPLAGNARNPLAPIGYQSLYEFSRMWIHRAEKSLAQVDVAPKR